MLEGAMFSQVSFVQSAAEDLGFLNDESVDLVIAGANHTLLVTFKS